MNSSNPRRVLEVCVEEFVNQQQSDKNKKHTYTTEEFFNFLPSSHFQGLHIDWIESKKIVVGKNFNVSYCPAKYYCPDYTRILPCPTGHYCKAGIHAPIDCNPSWLCFERDTVSKRFTPTAVRHIIPLLTFYFLN